MEPKIEYKSKVSGLIASLPDFLKDPANFEDIQKKILKTIQTSCTHSEVFEMAACKKCTENMLKRRKYLKDLGFKNAAQYMAWRRVHEKIKTMMPLVDWKKKQIITP